MFARTRPDSGPASVGGAPGLAVSRAGRRERSRRRILEAASQILAEGDERKFTVREIASRAHVSAGLVMQHFRAMADLVLEVFMEANAGMDAQLVAAASTAATTRERIVQTLGWLLERDLGRSLLTGRMMGFAWTWSAEHEERFQSGNRALTAHLVSLLDDPAHPSTEAAREAAAAAVVAIYNFHLRRAATAGRGPADTLGQIAEGLDLVLAGLYAGRGGAADAPRLSTAASAAESTLDAEPL